jgi:PAS domain S-box-containing protein
VPVGLAFLDHELRYLYINEMLAACNGLPAEQHIGRTVREVLPPELTDKIEPLLLAVLESKKPVINLELRFPLGFESGKPHDWLVDYFPATVNGQPGLYAVLLDITDRKTAERELGAAESRFRATFEQNAIGVAHVSLDGRWLDVNQRVCDIVGYSREELLQLTFADITHPDDMEEKLLAGYRDLLRERAPRYHLEKRYIRRDGEVIWVSLSGSLMRDEHGKPQFEICVIEDITASKIAEAKFAEGRERLQAALDAAQTGTFRWNILTNELDWDENLDALFGLAPGSTAKSLDQFIAMVHPDERAGVIERCQRCAKEGADFEMEFRVIWPDGSIHWLYDRGKRWASADGKHVYMTGACVDITQRKAVSEALRDSEERLRLAMSAGQSGSFEWDIVNDVNRWSPEIEILYGLKPGTFPGTYAAWRKFVHPADLPQAEEKARLSLITGELNAEWRIMRADTGEIRWISARGKVLFDEHDKPNRMIGINLDITREKMVQQELRRNSQILDQIHDAVIATDLNGHITLWNKGSEQRLGYTAEEVIGRYVGLIYRPQDQEFLRGAVILPLQQKGRHEVEVRQVRKDGGDFFAHLSLSMLNDENGMPIGMIGYAMDITERKKAEAALRQSEKLAATGRLASTLAHEINNPLAAITNVLYLLRHKPGLDEETLSQLSMADEELRRVSHITRNLLSFHREPVSPVAVHLPTIVEDVLVLYRPKLQEKNIDVMKEFDDKATIIAYPGEMRQVVSNLVSNAIEASPEGQQLRIRVSQSSVNGHGPRARIFVADHGLGVRKHLRQQIFEPFFTTKGEKGTGLGLWITRELVSKHSGSILLRSSSKGSCFIVDLPADRAFAATY